MVQLHKKKTTVQWKYYKALIKINRGKEKGAFRELNSGPLAP